MPEEVTSDSAVSGPFQNGPILPQKLRPVANQLQQLNSDERRKVLRAIGANQRGSGTPPAVQSGHYIEASFWQGVTPPAAELQKIEEVIPGGAERFLAMAERQQQHRFELETKVITAQLSQSKTGQIFALVIGLSGLVCSGYVAHLGHPGAAGSIAGVALGSLAVTFIIGKQQEKQNREAKQQ